MQDTKHTYTHVEASGLVCGLYQCNDCGATAYLKRLVEHYPTCKPGQRWEEFHSKVTIRTNLDQIGDDEESDRYQVQFGDNFYRSVSYASVERLRKRIRIGLLDCWLWRW